MLLPLSYAHAQKECATCTHTETCHRPLRGRGGAQGSEPERGLRVGGDEGSVMGLRSLGHRGEI